MRTIDLRGDTPTMDVADSLKVKLIEHKFQFRKIANDPKMVESIVDTINLMGGAGLAAEDDYQTCLCGLRRKTKVVCAAVAEEYFSMPEDQYLDRWSLIMLLADLSGKDCAKTFADILESKIPEERSDDPESFTTVGEEIMIRTTAIEGLERMAVDGNDEAMEVLLTNVRHESFSIRRAAVQAVIASGDKETVAKLREMLPSRNHELLKIYRADVREVEQAEGGLFLKTNDEDGTPSPDDEGSSKKSDC